jgi:hypothetical protein
MGYRTMPAFTLIVLDRTHHPYGVKCAKCGKALKPGQKAWKHTAVMKVAITAPKCYKAPYGISSVSFRSSRMTSMLSSGYCARISPYSNTSFLKTVSNK